MKSDLVDLTLQIHARTNRAILVSDDGDRERAVWVPLAHVEVAPQGRHHVVTMPEWLAIDRGLV